MSMGELVQVIQRNKDWEAKLVVYMIIWRLCQYHNGYRKHYYQTW